MDWTDIWALKADSRAGENRFESIRI